MSYRINFQKSKRNFMTLTFDDVDGEGKAIERNILVGMPKKRVFTLLMDLRGTLKLDKETATETEKAEHDKQLVDDLYSLTTAILSNNINREKISQEWVEEQMDIEQIKEFLHAYVKFCKGEAANPN